MNTNHFTNEYGASIHKNIEDGKTKIFDNEIDAQEYAREIRRYCFPVYEHSKTNGYYAVPL